MFKTLKINNTMFISFSNYFGEQYLMILFYFLFIHNYNNVLKSYSCNFLNENIFLHTFMYGSVKKILRYILIWISN